jgi:HEAT repeat protein
MALGSRQGPAVERALLDALKDRSFIVRQVAARSLAHVSPQLPAEAVASALHPGEGSPGAVSAEEIIKHGLWSLPNIEAAATLVGALDSAQEVDRAMYLHALGEIGDKRAVPALIEHLDDPDEGARESAAEALGKLRDPMAIGPLADRIDDPSKRVQKAVVEALRELGEPASAALGRAATTASSRDVRRRARRATKRLG